jgi:predicted phosphate transport protein (TIGR00153 family)
VFKFLFKKEHQVERLIYAYLDNIKLSQASFDNALKECFLHGERCENFEFFLQQTHKYESKADDVRQEINDLMYGKALIPDSRGDIMGLLAALDVIPHLFENILYMIQTQRIHLPKILRVDLKALVGLSLETCDLLYRQCEALFKKNTGIRELVNTIDTNESHCDHFERTLITKLFDSDTDPFLKLQLKELLLEIGEISDQADRVSKRINIISMKRRV